MLIKRTLGKIILFFSKFYFLFFKRDKKLWVFGEWFGNRCCDNCLYFANFVSETRPDIKIVWISNPEVDTSRLSKKITRIIIDSKEAKSYLKHAGVVFMSHGMVDLTHKEIHYYSGALTVNLWHGSTPWKKIHYDTPMDIFHKCLMLLYTSLHEGNLYIISSDKVFNIFKSAFRCSEKNIIKAGCPKNSVLYSKDFLERSREELIKYCRRINSSINDKVIIITYLPTFRDKSQEIFSFDMLNNKHFSRMLEEYNMVLIQKLHYASLSTLAEHPNNPRIINLKDYYTQELLAASDILVSDYSSCFFDYLVLDRPIIHYFYDYERFRNNDRGLYFAKEDVVCGDVADNLEDLLLYIELSVNDNKRGGELRARRRKEYLMYESCDSCKKILDRILMAI